MAVQVGLSGLKKAAVPVATIGEEPASIIFKHLREDEIERLAKELAQLGPIAPDVGERVLEEFHQMSAAATYVNQGGFDYARKLLDRTLGSDESRRIL